MEVKVIFFTSDCIAGYRAKTYARGNYEQLRVRSVCQIHASSIGLAQH